MLSLCWAMRTHCLVSPDSILYQEGLAGAALPPSWLLGAAAVISYSYFLDTLSAWLPGDLAGGGWKGEAQEVTDWTAVTQAPTGHSVGNLGGCQPASSTEWESHLLPELSLLQRPDCCLRSHPRWAIPGKELSLQVGDTWQSWISTAGIAQGTEP